jgi:4-oxalocrotonate tautomerase family enzyme
MPILHVHYARQVDEDTERKLIAALTDTLVAHLDVPAGAVAVLLEPVPSSRWGVGGTPLSDHGI